MIEAQYEPPTHPRTFDVRIIEREGVPDDAGGLTGELDARACKAAQRAAFLRLFLCQVPALPPDVAPTVHDEFVWLIAPDPYQGGSRIVVLSSYGTFISVACRRSRLLFLDGALPDSLGASLWTATLRSPREMPDIWPMLDAFLRHGQCPPGGYMGIPSFAQGGMLALIDMRPSEVGRYLQAMGPGSYRIHRYTVPMSGVHAFTHDEHAQYSAEECLIHVSATEFHVEHLTGDSEAPRD